MNDREDDTETVLKINGREVWKAVERQGVMAAQMRNQAQREVAREFVETELPAALEHLADRPATGDNIIRAMAAYGRQSLVEGGFIRRLIDAAPDELKTMFGGDELYEFSADILKTVLDSIEDVPDDYQNFLKYEAEISEAEFLARAGMSDENIALVAAGQLTIAQLIVSQPGVILTIQK